LNEVIGDASQRDGGDIQFVLADKAKQQVEWTLEVL
jgi:hypothetical protein